MNKLCLHDDRGLACPDSLHPRRTPPRNRLRTGGPPETEAIWRPDETWESDAVITNALRGVLMLWLLVAGLYGALIGVRVKEDLSHLVKATRLILLMLSASVVAAKLAAGFVGLSSRKTGVAFLSTSIFVNLTKIVVLAARILTLLQTLGIPITPPTTMRRIF